MTAPTTRPLLPARADDAAAPTGVSSMSSQYATPVASPYPPYRQLIDTRVSRPVSNSTCTCRQSAVPSTASDRKSVPWTFSIAPAPVDFLSPSVFTHADSRYFVFGSTATSAYQLESAPRVDLIISDRVPVRAT